MLQTSTITELSTLLTEQGRTTPILALSPDDNAFYNSLKEELNKIALNPSDETLENILNYSKSLKA